MEPRRNAMIGGAVAGVAALVLGTVLTLPEPFLRPDLSLILQAGVGGAIAVVAAIVGASATRDDNGPRLAAAVAMGILAFQALAFGVLWQITAPLGIQISAATGAVITSPNAEAVGPLAWQAGWAVAATLGLVATGLLERDKGPRKVPETLRRLVAPAVGMVAVIDIALLVLRPSIDGSALRALVDDQVPAAGLLGPASWLFAIVSVGALAVIVWMSWLTLPSAKAGRRAGRALVAAGLMAIALQVAVLTRPTEATPFVQFADILQPLMAVAIVIALLQERSTERGSDRESAGTATAQAEIASMAAHEIRGPVAAIRGVVATSLHHHEQLGPDERRELLEMLDAESQQLLVTVDQIALALRMNADPDQIDRRDADIAALVRASVAAAATDTEGRAVHVLVEGGLTARVDQGRVVEALRQILRNAARFSPDDAPVVIRAVGEDDAVIIDVIDEGPGIPPERGEEVFERFVLWRPPGYEQSGGSGLGLWIARTIARAHGGEASAETDPGGGTMLRVRLPREPGS